MLYIFTGIKAERQRTRGSEPSTNQSQQTTDSSTGKPTFILGLFLNT